MAAIELTWLESAWTHYVAMARRPCESVLGDTLFPHYTEKGRWVYLDVGATTNGNIGTYDHGNWTAGFWCGVQWLVALDRPGKNHIRMISECCAVLESRSNDSTTHDLGFLFYPSFVLGYQLGFLRGKAVPLMAAEMVARRFNERGAYIQAFGPIGASTLDGTSTVDTMMNLPLLWWAASTGTDGRLYEVAIRHARTTAAHFFRSDGSLYHLVRFDPQNGRVVHRGTFQGATDSSCWSRGQAWGVAGFAWAFAATGETSFLRAADIAAGYFEAHLPPSGIPPWDFAEAGDVPLDSSAAAIAVVGYLILAEIHENRDARRSYAVLAEQLLRGLSHCINSDPHVHGILMHSCYSVPHRVGQHASVSWGNFYYGLALALATGRISVSVLLGRARRRPSALAGVVGKACR